MSTVAAPEARWSRLSEFWSDYRQSKVALVALFVIVLVVLMAVFAPVISPQDPYNQATLDLGAARLEPGETGPAGYVHMLGTDAAGRDIFSAILYGLRTSLLVGVMAGTCALLLGSFVGLLAAYHGGRTEALLMRIIDLQLSLPAILLALVLVALLGQGLLQLVAALVAGPVRVLRAHRPRRGQRRTRQGLHRGRACHAAARAACVVPPCAAQRAAAAAGGGHGAGGQLDRAGGHPVLPGPGPAADTTFAGLADLQWLPVHAVGRTGSRSTPASR
jgi:hypothetical protein